MLSFLRFTGQKMKSKRYALRFPCGHHVVSFKTAYDAGEALLLNVSIEGCAFVESSLPLSLQEKILVSIALPGEEQIFQAQGVVVRVESGGCTAIRFTLVEPEDQAMVRNAFSKLMRKK